MLFRSVKAGKYNEAIKVLNKDLEINPNNGWALTGLATCYRVLKNKTALAIVQKHLATAWLIKDTNIEVVVF